MRRHVLSRTVVVLLLVTAVGVVGTAPAFAALPKIKQFSPISGPAGTSVTILGANFTGASSVAFNGTLSVFTVNSVSKITATVPAGATTGPIAISTPGGDAISATSFTVVPPVPTIVASPSTGPPGKMLTVSGSNFGASETVDVYFDTADMVLASTGATGSFSTTLSVPAWAAPGTHWITADGRRSGLSAQTSFLVQTDWAQFRGGPKHRGRNSTENVLNSGTVSGIDLDWSFTTGGIVSSSPVVANGVVYVGSEDHKVYARNASTGAQLWSFTAGGAVKSSPAVAGGVVYVGSDDSKVYALSTSTGESLWSFTTGAMVESSPAVAGGVVYVGSDDGKVYALNAATGTQLWSFTVGQPVLSSPAVANGVVYFGSWDLKVYALNASTGGLIWSFTTGFFVQSSPTVANGVVYIGSRDNKVYALTASTGALLWSFTTGGAVFSSPAVENGTVYIGSDDAKVYALNASTGAQLWFAPTGFKVWSAPAVANDVVYIGSGDGKVYAFNTYSGTRLWSYDTGVFVQSSPAVVNGTVYAGSRGGAFFAFDLAGGSSVVARPDPRTLVPDRHLKPV